MSLVVSTLLSITVWYTDSLDKAGVVVVAAGYSILNVLIFYFIGNILEKEAKDTQSTGHTDSDAEPDRDGGEYSEK